MTTETKQAPETIEEIAARIVDERLDEMMTPREYGSTRGLLIIDFVQALRNERERCAKIAEARAERYRQKSRTQRRRGIDSLSEHFLSECNAALEVAQAIRKGE